MASPHRSAGSPERQASPTRDSDPASSSPLPSTSQPAAAVEPWADPSAFVSVASRDPSTPDPGASGPSQPPTAASDGTNSDNPRIPWTGRIPAFFQLGPDGSLIPHFPPAPPPTDSAQPNGGAANANLAHAQTTTPATGGAANGTQAAPSALPHFHLPPLPADGRFPPFFPFMLPISGLRNRRPDPEAAAELLRSLPTVEKGLFRRVERVIIAEQVKNDEDGEEQGWKCGICLEGHDLEAKETGIKALPCNHLFHGDCLEPWFATNHTCPTCRLDLDPLKTLRRSRPNNAGRPGATGSGRSTPHPYARAGGATPPAVGIEAGSGAGDGPSFTFIWQMPLPADAALPAAAGQPEGARNALNGADDSAPAAPVSDRPQTPTLRFTFPLSASPLPINRERSASPFTRTDNPMTPMPADSTAVPSDSAPGSSPAAPSADTASATATPATPVEGGVPRPQPRRHITVIHHHHPPPAAPGSPHHHHHIHPHPGSPHHHHHHHLRPPGASTPVPAPSTPPSDPPPPVNEDTDATGGSADGSQRAGAASPDSRGPITPTDQSGTNNGPPTGRPHFHFFFNISDQPLPGGLPLPTGPGLDSAVQASEPADPPAQPERPSLTEWVTARERSLGWRCDAPDCGVAPAEDDDDDTVMTVEEDREMLSIFSMLQPPATAGSPLAENKGFELHSCEHRWHRSCLESVERTAGRSLRSDEQGRVVVRCEACRKEGWIWPRRRSMSEGEVEALCSAR